MDARWRGPDEIYGSNPRGKRGRRRRHGRSRSLERKPGKRNGRLVQGSVGLLHSPMDGLSFVTASPPVTSDPARADIACFVGFVARRAMPPRGAKESDADYLKRL